MFNASYCIETLTEVRHNVQRYSRTFYPWHFAQ